MNQMKTNHKYNLRPRTKKQIDGKWEERYSFHTFTT